MELFDTPEAMLAWSRARRLDGMSIAVVPTMGALHAGHTALVDAARRDADAVVLTIFVNPLQFNEASDFDRYPRPIDGDLAACRALGVDAVYAPTAATMYPPSFDTRVTPGRLAERLEGPMRPGHFEGVTTVVIKLFNAVEPDLAVFGQKDYQQLAIVRRMVADLDLPIEIVGVPTVREADGVALSSRNRRLTADARTAAVAIPTALRSAVDLHEAGERDARTLAAAARRVLDAEPRARVDYVEVVDAATLEPLEQVDRPGVIVVAVWFDDVRLIDNHQL